MLAGILTCSSVTVFWAFSVTPVCAAKGSLGRANPICQLRHGTREKLAQRAVQPVLGPSRRNLVNYFAVKTVKWPGRKALPESDPAVEGRSP